MAVGFVAYQIFVKRDQFVSIPNKNEIPDPLLENKPNTYPFSGLRINISVIINILFLDSESTYLLLTLYELRNRREKKRVFAVSPFIM